MNGHNNGKRRAGKLTKAPHSRAATPIAPGCGDGDNYQLDADTQERLPKEPTQVVVGGPGELAGAQSANSLRNVLEQGFSTFAGARNEEVAARITSQVCSSLRIARSTDIESALVLALSVIHEMEPRNLTESMLATQMIATHEAAVMFLERATLDGQTFEGSDANVLRATRLMRLHLDQIEAMQKLKGKTGQQKVTVEHVHVYQGGQAIVGAVNTKSEPGEGGGFEQR